MNAFFRFFKSIYQRSDQAYILRIILAVVIPLMLLSLVMVPFRVHGLSMAPTYSHNSTNFCWRGAYLFSEPKRFDVVLVRLEDENIFLLKRIIGLPGETIEFRNGTTLINGKPLNEPYLIYPWNWNMAPVSIKPNHIYIVGDNRNVKIYQHSFGEVPIDSLFGRVLW